MTAAIKSREAIRLRPVSLADADLLFDWVNRPDSLASKLRTKGPVSRSTHDKWLAARLADPDCFIWVVERDGRPAGQVRLEGGSGEYSGKYEVDIYIDAEVRGRGSATAGLRSALTELATVRPGARAVARIRPGNQASRRLFARLGFTVVEQLSDHIVCMLSLDEG